MEALDLQILIWINGTVTHPWVDTFFVWLTKPPHREFYFIGAALALIAFGGRRGRIAALTLVFAIALADQISASVLKPWVERVRPCFAHPEEIRLLLSKQARSPSFPSSHAANAFATAVLLFPVRRWLGWGMLGLAALIAYSRPYVGVHYPSDILAGALLGTAIGFGCLWGRKGLIRLWARYRAKRSES